MTLDYDQSGRADLETCCPATNTQHESRDRPLKKRCRDEFDADGRAGSIPAAFSPFSSSTFTSSSSSPSCCKRLHGPEPSWAGLARGDSELLAEFAARPVQPADRDNTSYLEWVAAYAAYAVRPVQEALAPELAAHPYWSVLAAPWPVSAPLAGRDRDGDGDGDRDEESLHDSAMRRFLELRRLSKLDNFFAVAYEQGAADALRQTLRETSPSRTPCAEMAMGS